MTLSLLLAFILCNSIAVFAQTREQNNGITYQAVMRDGGGNILPNQEFNFRFDFTNTAEFVISYSELHTVSSDDFGIVNLVLLHGIAIGGTHFYDVDWENGRVSIAVIINEVEMGTIEFTDVPYAKYSDYSGGLVNPLFSETFSDVSIVVDELVDGSLLQYHNGNWQNQSALVVVGDSVGIGVATPAEKLEVNGNIKSHGEINCQKTGTANLVPIAYGLINSDGTTVATNTTANVSVAKQSTGVYYVTIADENYTYFNYVPILTTTTTGNIANSGSVNGQMIINVTDSSGTPSGGKVYFVIYKM